MREAKFQNRSKEPMTKLKLIATTDVRLIDEWRRVEVYVNALDDLGSIRVNILPREVAHRTSGSQQYKGGNFTYGADPGHGE
jgi:hypothetical protein